MQRPRVDDTSDAGGGSAAPDIFDGINARVWSEGANVDDFARMADWLDPGERHSIEAAAALMPTARVLDLGVGGGRTVDLLARFGDDYVGLDYVPGLVEACRQRHPGRTFVAGDARHLDSFGDASVDLVVFSNSGIDAVSHADRANVLSEVARVLVPGGLFVVSTYNLDGPSARERPWTLPGLTWRQPKLSASRVKYRLLTLPKGWRNYRRLAGEYEHGEGWAVTTNGSHEFGLVVHHCTLAVAHEELRAAGFEVVRTWAPDGRVLTPATRTRNIWYFHILCRRIAPTE